MYVVLDDQHDEDNDNDVDGGRLPLLLFIFYVGLDDDLPAKACFFRPFSPCAMASAVFFCVDCQLTLRGLSHTVLIHLFVFIVGSCQHNTPRFAFFKQYIFFTISTHWRTSLPKAEHPPSFKNHSTLRYFDINNFTAQNCHPK
jgi:hypothetical protein